MYLFYNLNVFLIATLRDTAISKTVDQKDDTNVAATKNLSRLEQMDVQLPSSPAVSVSKKALFRLAIECLNTLKSFIALGVLLYILMESIRQGLDLHHVKKSFENFLGVTKLNHT